MQHPFRFVAGLAVIAAGLWGIGLSAQPPGPGPKGRPAPPPPPAAGGEFRTVRGTVRDFTTAPRGEVDGLVLADGTVVHWRPHLQGRFSALVAKGDRVRAAGYWETGPAGDTKLEVSSLTNLASNRTVENPDRPAPVTARRGGDAADDLAQRVRALEEKVDRLTDEVARLRRP